MATVDLNNKGLMNRFKIKSPKPTTPKQKEQINLNQFDDKIGDFGQEKGKKVSSKPLDRFNVAQLLDRPIPGQHLTEDPDADLPYNKPPKYTNVEDAQRALFDTLMDESSIEITLEMINRGVPLTSITEMVLTKGLVTGQWISSLMLLLVEPCIYILIFMCDIAGIQYNITSDDSVLLHNDLERHTALKQLASNTGAMGSINMFGVELNNFDIDSSTKSQIEELFAQSKQAITDVQEAGEEIQMDQSMTPPMQEQPQSLLGR